MTAIVVSSVVLLLLILAVLWRLKPASFRLSLRLWRLLHLELESERTAPTAVDSVR